MALKWTPALAAYFGLTALASPLMLSRSQRNIAPNRHRERSGIPTIPIKAGLTWVSAASVGELRAVLPLLPALGPTLVTTQTATAADLAETQGLLHQFTPIDTPAATTAFLRNWQLRTAIFVESEVPPRMITRLASQGIPTALIGARASKTRAKAPKSMANILSQLAVITAATPAVTDELTSLGLSVTATEDLKAALPTEPVPQAKLNKWTEVQQRPIWLAASTHPGDETVVLKAHQQVLEHQPDALLCLAPRHPERFAGVAAHIRSPVTRHNAGDIPDASTPVHLIDTMGELPLFYTLAPVTFLGGSFGALGGHSPFEPARYGSHVLTGPDVSHHTSAFAEVPHETVTPNTLAQAVLTKWKQPRPPDFAPKPATETQAALSQMINAVPCK